LYTPAAEAVARKIDVPAVAGFTPDKTQVPVVPVSEPTTVEPTSITTVVTYTADSGAMLPATGASESTVSAGRTAALMVGAGFIFAAVVYRRGAFRSQP
jgi:small neutral amino acid transporter SnatA (MarC family)